MAARTSTGTGMIVTLSIFALLTVVFFVIMIIALAKAKRAQDDLAAAQQTADQAVQIEDAIYETMAQEARGENMGAFDLALQQRNALIEFLASDAESVEEAKSQVNQLLEGTGLSSQSVTRRISSLQSELSSVRSQKQAAEQEIASMGSELEKVQNQISDLQSTYDGATSGIDEKLTSYSSQVEERLKSLDDVRDRVDQRVNDLRTDYEQQISSIESERDSLRQELQLLEQKVEGLTSKLRGTSPEPTAEEALVDGSVISSGGQQDQVFVDIGKGDKVVLGMTFEVYSEGTAIRPDESGEYPRGKGTIEIIQIEEGSSTARILRENEGRPIVQGDVIANAVYDPRKTYSFVVFGNFDTNNDGFYTEQEAEDIKGIIEEWGGEVTSSLEGDTDFVVLGAKPVPPPQPDADAPYSVLEHWTNLKEKSERYDDLLDLAQRTSVPVLNINRLYTLTGLYSRR